jgi:hypothetical protein
MTLGTSTGKTPVELPSAPAPAPGLAGSRGTWARWSSFVRLAVWGGSPRCTKCGSPRVRRSFEPQSPLSRALGLTACRCEACYAVFDVPRGATPPMHVADDEGEPDDMIVLPARPAVDLSALDREMARRLGRKPPLG